MKSIKDTRKELDKIPLSLKERIIEWVANLLILAMLIGFFFKIVFF